jgi:hypothetical protein
MRNINMDIKEEKKKYLDNRANDDALFAERYQRSIKASTNA